jgi:signal transduction histidine kinase
MNKARINRVLIRVAYTSVNGDTMDIPAINRLTGKFASGALETAFQRSIASENYRHNYIAIAIALPLNAVYAYFDLSMLEAPSFAWWARTAGLAASIVLFAGFHFPSMRRYHEHLTAMIVIILGGVMNAIMWQESTLANDYYVGLIQGGVFISFLVRIGFTKLLAALAITLSTFVLIAQMKGQPNEAYLQTTALTTMYALCAFGAYLFERHRRTEYAQSRTIEKQNAELARMLADARLDNERKLAALNVLVHFVRTPIHQIVGFTGVIANSLKAMEGRDFAEQIEHAELVRRASADLSSNVAKVLAYHRLDETPDRGEAELVQMGPMLSDLKEELSEFLDCRLGQHQLSIQARLEPVRAALTAFASYYRQEAKDASIVEISAHRSSSGITLRVEDDGAALTAETFADQIKPLTRIDKYLMTDGSAMPMTLRTVARAAEICAGSLTFQRATDRNIFLLEFADRQAKANAA